MKNVIKSGPLNDLMRAAVENTSGECFCCGGYPAVQMTACEVPTQIPDEKGWAAYGVCQQCFDLPDHGTTKCDRKIAEVFGAVNV